MKYIFMIITFLMPMTVLAQDAISQSIKDYAANIQDNGKSLENEKFSLGYGTIKGKIYYDNPEEYIYAQISNPFSLDYTEVKVPIADDGTFKIKLPMVVTHQLVEIRTQRCIDTELLLSQGKTVEVFYDETRKPGWRSERMPYFKGANADINYAINLIDKDDLMIVKDDDEDNNYVANCSPNELKQYAITKMNNYIAKYDSMDITTRAKEMIKIRFNGATFFQLNRSDEILKIAYRRTHHKGLTDSIPEYVEPIFDDYYWDYPKLLGMDDMNMYYSLILGRHYYNWTIKRTTLFTTWDSYVQWQIQLYQLLQSKEKLSTNEVKLIPGIIEKTRNMDYNYTDEEKAFMERYADQQKQIYKEVWSDVIARRDSLFENWFGKNDSYVGDLIKLFQYCYDANPIKVLSSSNEPLIMPDSLMHKIKEMRFPIYYDYFNRVKCDANTQLLQLKKAEEAQRLLFEKRGGYHVHEINVKDNDSVFDAMLTLFKGKVILIDFEYYWKQYGKNQSDLIKNYDTLKDSFSGKNVAFVYIASPSVSTADWEEKSRTIPGNHLHVNEFVHNALASEFCQDDRWFHPQIILVGKDGSVKDVQSSFKGIEYYKQKIMEELKK